MRIAVVLIVGILMAFGWNLFFSPDDTEVSEMMTDSAPAVEEVQSGSALGEAVQDKPGPFSTEDIQTGENDRSARMAAEYETLEKARKKLKRRLSRLRHDMWGLTFPPAQAKEMKEILQNAYRLIKNPDMLGAFSDVKGIREEVIKIDFAEKSLERIDTMIKQNRKSGKESG